MEKERLIELRNERDVVKVNFDGEKFIIQALILPLDMTKSDLPEQTYVFLPARFAREVCESILNRLENSKF